MSKAYSKQQAELLIQRLQTRDPLQIARELDIGIKYADLGSLKGFYSIMLGNPFIVLNESLHETEAKIVLAHELGHHILHAHLAKQDGVRETVLYDLSSQPEYEANVFAAHLLLDETQVRQLAADGTTRTQMAALLSVEPPLIDIFLETL